MAEGSVTTHKAQILARFTTHATVVAPEITEELEAHYPSHIKEKTFEAADPDGVQLLFVCTGDHELNHHIKELAAERHILTSVCDDPAQCDFISPAIYRDDNLTIAVGSDSRDVKKKHPSKKQNKRIDRKWYITNRLTKASSLEGTDIKEQEKVFDDFLQDSLLEIQGSHINNHFPIPYIFLKTCNRSEIYYGEARSPG